MTVEDLNKVLEVHGQLSDKLPMLFLDEIQNIEGWEKFARRIADNKYKEDNTVSICDTMLRERLNKE